MAYDHKAIRHERQQPVPPQRTDGKQLHRGDVRTKAPVQPVEPLDLPDVTRTPGTLKDDRGVVAAFQLRAEAFVQDGFGPSRVEVDVGRVVHAIHGARAGRPGRDFAEYGFAVLLAIPLHMRESRLKAERLQHGASHLPAALQMISFDVAQCDRLGTNPLFLAGDQGARPIQAHVPEHDFAVDADRVERVLHRLDEFLDIDVPSLPETSEHGIELEPRVDAEGISRAGPGDGLHDDGETDLLRGALALGRVRRAPVPGRTNAG